MVQVQRDLGEVVAALAGASKAPAVGVRNLYLQFVFAWLPRNGDLHAKNVSILEARYGGFVVPPVYDIPCTLLTGTTPWRCQWPAGLGI